MDSNYKAYSHTASYDRLKGILDQSDVSYTEKDSLPSRDELTFSNGFYANCSALFIDIRKSSALPDKYTRPRLAKLYRAFISEVVAVLNGDTRCVEVNIVGDGAWAVYNTPWKADIDATFSAAAKLASLVKMLNKALVARNYEAIRVGIGMSWGRALMIKAGYSGSGINDVVYMGEVVNLAAKLASYGCQNIGDQQMMVSNVFHSNLNDHNRSLLSWNVSRNCWHGWVVNSQMDEWVEALP